MFRVRQSPSFESIADRFSNAAQNVETDVRQGIRSLAGKFEQHAGQQARGGPSGTIARQTRAVVEGKGFKTEVGKIAEYHLTGTGIHGPSRRPIVPIRAKALRMVIGGTPLFRKFSSGVKPDPYLSRAHEAWLPEAEREMTSIAEKFARNV